ncbi:MAG: alpha/beta hydrolase [Chloroflexota bacterium]
MRSEKLAAASADREFTAKLTLPKGAGPFPAVVCLHPANDPTRDHFLFLHLEALLPPLGIAVARFDRRGKDVPFLDQARDVEAVLEALAARPDIDTARIGLFGFSQGAWVAPLVASRSDRVAFLILVAAAGVSPVEQMRFGIAKHARAAGRSAAEVDSVLALWNAFTDFARGARPRVEVQRLIDQAKAEPWFELAHVRPELPEEPGFLPDMDFDPVPYIAAVHVPTLIFYGEDDEWQPTAVSVAAWERAGTRDLMIARIPNTGHAPTAPGGTDVASVLPRYTDTLGAWIKRVARLA